MSFKIFGKLVDSLNDFICDDENLDFEKVGESLDKVIHTIDDETDEYLNDDNENMNEYDVNVSDDEQRNKVWFPNSSKRKYEVKFDDDDDDKENMNEYDVNVSDGEQRNKGWFPNSSKRKYEVKFDDDDDNNHDVEVQYISDDFPAPFKDVSEQRVRQVSVPKKLTRNDGPFYFTIGVRKLNCVGGGMAFDNRLAYHVCFLLYKDIFEYGLPEYGGDFIRRRNVGRMEEFNWKIFEKEYRNKTYVTPDLLEEVIIKSGLWTGEQYQFMSCPFMKESHNCHDFVQFCLMACCEKGSKLPYKKHDCFYPKEKPPFLKKLSQIMRTLS